MQGIVTLLNAACILVTGVWLAVLGEWWALAGGFFALFTAHLLIATLMMPSVAFTAPAFYLQDKGWGIFAIPFLMAESLYTYVLIGLWCILVLHLSLSQADDASLWPLLIWSYGVALAPWAYLARQEKQAGIGGPIAFAAVPARIAYAAACGAVAFLDLWLFSAAKLFVLVIAAGAIVQIVLTLQRSRAAMKRARKTAEDGIVAKSPNEIA